MVSRATLAMSWIYLEEGPLLAGTSIGCHGSGTETHHRNSAAGGGRKRSEDVSQRSLAVVVTERMVPFRGLEALGPMLGGTVHEDPHALRNIFAYFPHARKSSAPLEVRCAAKRLPLVRPARLRQWRE